MATTRREYVFATFLSSCAALVLLIVACSTNVWISADLERKTGDLPGSKANYGLFSGTFVKQVALTNTATIVIKIVCDFGENVCAWSCLGDSDERKDELKSLLFNGTPNINCSYVDTTSRTFLSSMKNVTTMSRADEEAGSRVLFLNAGLWLTTLMALILALLVTAVAALLAVINTAANPRSSILAVPGLYCSNAVAAGLDLLCLILWGCHFAVRLKTSIGLNEVISQDFLSDNGTVLGWSYWLVLVALIISIANIAVLFWRDYLIKREPPPPTYNPEKEAADGTLFLY